MSRTVRILVGLVVVVVALVGAGRFAVWLTGRQTAEVAMPSADARPDEVVRTYLEALDAHDCGTAVALRSTRQDSRQLARIWCREVHHLRAVEVEPAVVTTGEVEVVTRYDLSYRPFTHVDWPSAGHRVWTYALERASPSAPWRITDEYEGDDAY